MRGAGKKRVGGGAAAIRGRGDRTQQISGCVGKHTTRTPKWHSNSQRHS